MSRRELLAFGTGAVATLLAGITGVGWRNSKNRESKVSALLADLEGLDLDQTISEAIAELDPRIESLNELIQTTHRHKQDDDLTVRNYQSLYMPAQQAIQRLEIAVGNMQGLYTRLSDTGMNSPALMQELLGVINLFPPAREYTGAFNIMLEMVKGIPDFLQNSGAVIREMQAWFSPERGIDALLLQPLQSNLFPHIDELYDQTSTLKDTWERQLVERSTELIRERKRIKEGAAL